MLTKPLQYFDSVIFHSFRSRLDDVLVIIVQIQIFMDQFQPALAVGIDELPLFDTQSNHG